MAEKHFGTAVVGGALTGLGLNGIGAYLMNKAMPHGDAQRPIWHENTIGLTPTSMVMIFCGLLVLAVLYVFDTESRRSNTIYLKSVALFVVLWAVFSALVN